MIEVIGRDLPGRQCHEPRSFRVGRFLEADALIAVLGTKPGPFTASPAITVFGVNSIALSTAKSRFK